MVIDWMRAMLEKKAEPIFSDFLLGLIIEDAEKGGDWITRGAPNIIVTHGPNDLPIPASQSGCMIALTTLELAAPAFGLGACWAGYFNAAVNLWPPLSQALAIPANHGCYGAMMVGYPRNECYRIPIRKEAPVRWL
jgi:nitroreductase